MSELIPLGAGREAQEAPRGVTETQGRAPSSGQRARGTRRARRVLCRGRCRGQRRGAWGGLGGPAPGTRRTPRQFLASQRITSRDCKRVRLYLQ